MSWKGHENWAVNLTNSYVQINEATFKLSSGIICGLNRRDCLQLKLPVIRIT